MYSHSRLCLLLQGSLYLWDVVKGEVLRVVDVGSREGSATVRHMTVVDDCVICAVGSQLRVIRFPSVLEKAD